MQQPATAWRRAAADVTAALAEVRPLSWCTPQPGAVPAVVAAASTAGQPPTLLFRYPAVPARPVVDRLTMVLNESIPLLAGHPLADVVADCVSGAIKTVKTIAARDDAAFSAWSRATYGLPAPDVVAAAETALALTDEGPDDDEPTVTGAELAARVEALLALVDVHGWQVQLREASVSRVSVSGSQNCVWINSGAVFGAREARQLLAHEVGGHVLRWVNAKEQPDPVAALQLPGAVITEEGLAAWIEQQQVGGGGQRWRLFAARARAVQLGQKLGVVELTRHLAEQLDWTEAATIAVRIKRGLIDPGQPGGYTKDHAYYTGLLQLQTLLGAEPHTLPLLMATKWPARYLPLTADLLNSGRLRLPAHLPDTEALTTA